MKIVAKVLSVCDIPSTGPDILLFKCFQQQWKFIDREQFKVFESSMTDREDILSFCRKQPAIKQPRDDYQEILELTMTFLGAVPYRDIRVMQLDALYRAR